MEWRAERGTMDVVDVYLIIEDWTWWMYMYSFRQQCSSEWRAERGSMDVMDV